MPRLRSRQREDVGRPLDPAALEEQLDLLVAQAFDVEGEARGKMLQALHHLGAADEAAGAAAHHVLLAGARIDLAHRMAAAHRADLREYVGLRTRRPLLQHDAEHLRDDIAGALDAHGVADPHVLAGDLVLVVQRRIGDDDAADGDRLEPRHRGQRPGAADLDVDAVEDGGRLLGREFVRRRPARTARDEAEPLLQVEPVDLVDDAVDVVAERRAAGLDVAIDREHLLDRMRELGQRIDAKAAALEPFEHAELGVLRHLAHLAPGIGEEFERPARRDRRVELAQRAGGRIAGIGEDLLALGRLPLVEREEVGMGHVDLAAYLADIRVAVPVQPFRNFADGADIGGDVLAFEAVAAGRGVDEVAALVAQRAGQAVDLGLGGEGERIIGGEAEEPLHPIGEIDHLLVVEHVAEREHRHRVADLGELTGRRRANPTAGRIGPDQVGEQRLDGVVTLPQRVVFAIREGRRVLLIVALVMDRNLGGEPLELGLGLGSGQRVGGNARGVLGGHRINRFEWAGPAAMALPDLPCLAAAGRVTCGCNHIQGARVQ